MIKNIVFDIGNVIFNFDVNDALKKYTPNEEDQKFLMDNVINSPEWHGLALIDTGYISIDEAISLVEDRTNHEKDDIVEGFWHTYNKYGYIDQNVLRLIKYLKEKGYKIYLLSNMNSYTNEKLKEAGLYSLVDGYVLSFEVHQVKPFIAIYNTLINKYNIDPRNSLFIDNYKDNVDTALNMGFIGKLVNNDDYNSVVDKLKEEINIDDYEV